MKQQKNRRGLLASAAALVTTAALALGGAAAANADPFPIPENSDVTITKYSQGAIGEAASGIESGQAGGPEIPAGSVAIGDVEFEYYLVTGTDAGEANDIGTNAGQQYAAGLTAQSVEDDNLAPSLTGTFAPTDATSGATTANLDRGLYLVKEKAPLPEGVVAAPPFLLAVPLTDPNNRNAWLDHIFVYPKNTSVNATKEVDEAGVIETGQNVTWTIETDVPRFEEDGAYVAPTSFEITDQLDARLTFVSETVTVGGTPLTEGTGADYVLVETDGLIKITFEPNGLVALQNVAGTTNSKVEVKLITTVNSAVVPTGATTAITNQANVLVNEGRDDEIDIETDVAQTNWGVISFTKTDDADTPAALDGAEFQLFATEDDAENLNNPLISSAAVVSTSDSTNNVTFDGVRTSDRVNGVMLDDEADYQVYWIRETKAPEGFQLLAEAVPVVLLTDGKIYSVNLDASNTVETVGAELTTITNVSTAGGFTLPLTGGMGTWFLAVIGAVIVGSVVFIVRRRNREDEELAA